MHSHVSRGLSKSRWKKSAFPGGVPLEPAVTSTTHREWSRGWGRSGAQAV